jgi:ubiquinone/menaquinone biosynthesis C-methylase UbiE
MGFGKWYEEKILSRFIRLACGDPKIMELREAVIPLAEGRVFELGVGGGLNQQFYDALRVTGFAGIDPGAKLLDFARSEAAKKGWQVDIREGRGEAIPFEDESFDTVVSTYTLCSVDDQAQVLRELRRILKPGGKIIYLEHGKAPDRGPQKWQRRIEPVWKRVMGNCHLTREVGGAVKQAGFSMEPIGSQYMPKTPKWAGWMEWGVGWKEGQ